MTPPFSQSNEGAIMAAVRAVEDPLVRRTMLHWIPWRNEGTLVYACVDPEDTDGLNDEHVGTMVTEKIAEEAVMSHNATLKQVDR